jgi:hypothetical protein
LILEDGIVDWSLARLDTRKFWKWKLGITSFEDLLALHNLIIVPLRFVLHRRRKVVKTV